MARRVVVIAAMMPAIAVGAYAIGAAQDSGETVRRVVVAGSTDTDPTGDRWVTAECPEGMTAVGGGAQIPHGNDTPGVALYWSAPYADHGTSGWWAAAQDTARRRRAWLLQVQAICLSGVEEVESASGSLPPKTYGPATEP